MRESNTSPNIRRNRLLLRLNTGIKGHETCTMIVIGALCWKGLQ